MIRRGNYNANKFGAVKVAHPERTFQKQLVAHLRLALPPDVFMTAFPAGGGGEIRGAHLKAMGLVAGVPDLLFVHRGQLYGMELKAKRGVLSENQELCQDYLAQAGVDCVTVRTLAEAYRALDAWGIPTRSRLAA